MGSASGGQSAAVPENGRGRRRSGCPVASADPVWARAQKHSKGFPTVTLGKTGQKVPCSAWAQAGTSHPASCRPRFSPGFATSTPPRATNAATAEDAGRGARTHEECARTSTWSPRTACGKVGGPRAFNAYVQAVSNGQPRAAADRLHRLLLPPRRRAAGEISLAYRSRRQGGV